MDPPFINYLDHNSVMVINPAGRMRQLYVPFKVIVIEPTISLKQDSWVIIEEVYTHTEHKLIYRVGNQWWPYSIFRLEVRF